MTLGKFNNEDVDIYLTSLRDEITPFDVFVSRAGRSAVKDKIDLAAPRSRVTRAVRRSLMSTIQDKVTRFIPIIGPAGSGKTHFFWYLTEEEDAQPVKEWVSCYIPSPPSSVRIPLHLYTSILDDIGEDLLNISSEKLVKSNSTEESTIDQILTNCLRIYPGIASDVIKAMILFNKGESNKKTLAERWLLGDTLGEEELESLGVIRIVEDDDIVLASLRIFFENYDKTILLYFDELEIPYRTLGKNTAAAFIEHLKRMYNEMGNLVIITACLLDIWPEIYNSMDDAMKSRLEREAKLMPFNLEDIQNFYRDSMKMWWIDTQNVEPPSDLLFPLSQYHFEEILEVSRGNPRSTIKSIRNKLDDIIDMRLEGDLDDSVDNKAIISKADMALLNAGQNVDITDHDLSLISEASALQQLTPEQLEILENVTIDINPTSIAAGVVSAIKGAFPNAIVEENFEFEFNQKIRFLAIKVTINGKKIGIEIPSVKSFDKRGGVAAYYALNRLIEALDKTIDFALIFVPHDTSGRKYQHSLSAVQEFVKTIEMNQDDAESVIKSGFIKQFSPKSSELIESIREYL